MAARLERKKSFEVALLCSHGNFKNKIVERTEQIWPDSSPKQAWDEGALADVISESSARMSLLSMFSSCGSVICLSVPLSVHPSVCLSGYLMENISIFPAKLMDTSTIRPLIISH